MSQSTNTTMKREAKEYSNSPPAKRVFEYENMEMSSFDDAIEDMDINCSTLGILTTEYLDIGTHPSLSQEVLNIYLQDVKFVVAKFSAYGKEAIKYKDLQRGTVIDLENYKWFENKKPNNVCKKKVVTETHEGKILKETAIKLNKKMTETCSTFLMPRGNPLYTLAQIDTHSYEFIAKFLYSHQKKEFSGRTKGCLQSHFFESADGMKVRLTFFNADVETEHKLSNGQVYKVKGATLKNNTACEYYDMDLSGYHYTGFEHMIIDEIIVDDQQEYDPEAQQITLANIIEENISSGNYRISCFARADPVVKGSNRHLIVLDGSTYNGKALASVLIISGLNTDISKAEDFTINVELKTEGGRINLYGNAASITNNDEQIIDKAILKIPMCIIKEEMSQHSMQK